MIEVTLIHEEELLFSSNKITILNDRWKNISTLRFDKMKIKIEKSLNSGSYLELNIRYKQKEGEIHNYMSLWFIPIVDINIRKDFFLPKTIKGAIEYKDFGDIYNQLTINWLYSFGQKKISLDNEWRMYDLEYENIIQKQLKTTNNTSYYRQYKDAYIDACSYWQGKGLSFNNHLCVIETNKLVDIIDIYASLAHQLLRKRSYIGANLHAFEDMLTDFFKLISPSITPEIVIKHKKCKFYKKEIFEEITLLKKILKKFKFNIKEEGIPPQKPRD